MDIKSLKMIAEKLSIFFNSEIEEIYDEEIEADAGFSLKNGITFQHVPYTPNPFIIDYFANDAMTPILSFANKQMMFDCLEEIKEKYIKLSTGTIASFLEKNSQPINPKI